MVVSHPSRKEHVIQPPSNSVKIVLKRYYEDRGVQPTLSQLKNYVKSHYLMSNCVDARLAESLDELQELGFCCQHFDHSQTNKLLTTQCV